MASQVGVQKTRIVVVGAGISGITATRSLLRLGFQDVTVLEASQRIGGRIRTTSFSDGWVEMGAQWIHGKHDNVVHEYATEHGLVADPDTRDANELHGLQCRTQDGLQIDKTLCDNTIQQLYSILDDIKTHQNRSDANLERHLDDRFWKTLAHVATGSEERDVKGALLDFFKKIQCSVDGCDSLSDMSLRSLSNYRECDGKQLTNLKKGYSAVVNSLAKEIPESVIVYGKIVDRIEIVDRSGRPPVSVSCSDGSQYEADHVLVTVSLGVLKHHVDTMFVPPLSAVKKRAIKEMGFGTVDKIFLQFERPFWSANCSGYDIMWTARGAPASDEVVDRHWSKGLFGFYVVPFASNVLCGWLSGEAARQMEAVVDDSEVLNTCLELLHRFTGKADIPRVVRMLRSGWNHDTCIRGSYSYLKSELPDSKLANDVLAEPIYQKKEGLMYPAVMFAGEATHPHYYSTVHGAWATGEREANRIAKFHSSSIASDPTAKL